MNDETINPATAAASAAVAVAKISESVALLSNDMGYMKKDVAEIKILLNNKYVTKEEQASVLKDVSLLQKIVFTGIGAVLLTILGAALSMLLKK